ncbi:PLP-dependent transferase [Coprinopsis sp. MPI-PUGE-AT-0042]|nr:PLP-dependent transferase [Coprinopsis sp. MPI-PUGE-AT-0042]
MHDALRSKLESALASREKRQIRRRLPDPSHHISSSSPSPPNIIDFTSNDYLSLSLSPHLRQKFLSNLSSSPDILGSGGSRLLINTPTHANFESRLKTFFNAPQALLFNSGFDANVGFFSAVPQKGDAIVYDEYIHAASVHDGMRASRVDKSLRISFAHSCLSSLHDALFSLKSRREFERGRSSIFVSVESLYSMDGTFAPLLEITQMIEEMFPLGNAYLVVDEAHSTGIYGPEGRGRVALLGLEDKVLARLVTFGKALAATGAVVLTNELIRDYLLNYARPLIYTTSLSLSSVIAADASLTMLSDGTAARLSSKLLDLSSSFTSSLLHRISSARIPPHLLSLPTHITSPPLAKHTSDPSPIIPLLTCRPRPLSTFLLSKHGINARPITWPTVPNGKDRVRVCLHAGNTKGEVDLLVRAVVEWAEGEVRKEGQEVQRMGNVGPRFGGGAGTREVGVLVASKL